MPKPTDIRIVGERELLITWDSGERTLYANVYLQLACQCAKCVDEKTGKQLIQEDHIDADSKLLDFEYIGNYGIKLKWSIGCPTGIYSFDYLYHIRPKEPSS